MFSKRRWCCLLYLGKGRILFFVVFTLAIGVVVPVLAELEHVLTTSRKLVRTLHRFALKKARNIRFSI